jgi:ATP-dependent DNA helicase RecQ
VRIYGRYDPGSDGWDDGFTDMLDSGDGASEFHIAYAAPDPDDRSYAYDEEDDSPSVAWLLEAIEQDLVDAEDPDTWEVQFGVSPGDVWPILELWQRRWGVLSERMLGCFLERPELDELIVYPIRAVARVIGEEPKLDRILRRVDADWRELLPTDGWDDDRLDPSDPGPRRHLRCHTSDLGPKRHLRCHTSAVPSPPVHPSVADQALDLLRQLTGRADASFHDGQREAIEALVGQRQRVLVVQRTGWGKSAVYFIATRLLRAQGAGPTLLVSPLLALMRNQIDAASRLGLRAESVNSENRDRWDEIKAALGRDEVDILLIAAQRFANQEFQREVLPIIGRRSGMIVVDEAHCISDWGHDFNPDYRRIGRVLERLPRGVPVLACTATANDRVVADVESQLGNNLVTLRGPLARRGLSLHVLDLASQAERLAWLASVLPRMPGSGIVYCLTVADTERVAAWLRRQAIDAHAYHGDTHSERRLELEGALLANRVKALVATSALGMGFDKPDLGFVVHFQSPGSPVHYYQQVGRAGRQIEQSWGVLLAGHEDEDIQDWFIKTAFPPKEKAEQVVALLGRDGASRSIREIEDRVNIRHSRLDAMLKILEVEGAVERDGTAWRRTLRPWAYDMERVAQVTRLRRFEQRVMRDYRATSHCRMELLGQVLDDQAAVPCGICDNCSGTRLPGTVEPGLVQTAEHHLRRSDIPLKPKSRYPTRVISAEHRIASGRALCRWGDGGWGGLVREGKQVDGRFADELVTAGRDLLTRWQPDPSPGWVTCVPSLRHPGLVPDYAERLAAALGLPFHPVVKKIAERPPQKEMENSSQQVRNVVGIFAIAGPVPSRPVLLIDDVWDSGWTITVAGEALSLAGAPAVHAMALATATGF